MYAAEQIRESHDYDKDRRYNRAARQQNPEHRIIKSKSYIKETCALFLCVLAFLGLNLFLLGRYADITSVKHHVSLMEMSLEKLQNQKEQLSVEIEKSSKLEWIEKEAVGRLGMQYPEKSQMIYISVDQARVAMIVNELENRQTEEKNRGLLPYSIEKLFHKFAGVLQI